MTATLFDLSQYHQKPAPDPNAPYSADEMLEFIAESQLENDHNRLNWLFMYLCRHGDHYGQAEHQRIHKGITQGFAAIDKAMTAQTKNL